MKPDILEKFKLQALTIDEATQSTNPWRSQSHGESQTEDETLNSESKSPKEKPISQRLSHLEQVKALCAAGAKWVQIRTKKWVYPEHLEMLQEIRAITSESDTILIINDDVTATAKIKADGVHLGKNDLPAQVARNVLGKNKIIGVTVNSIADAEKVKRDNVADYVGLGPFNTTTTKVNSAEPLSLEEIQKCVEILAPIPIVLIGGISLENINSASSQPVQGLAICSAISAHEQAATIRQAYEVFSNAISYSEL